MNIQFAQQFTQEWMHAWNAHDLTAIMQHYAEEVQFHSPIIRQLGVNQEGRITDKNQLRAYFAKALELYPDLRFQLHHTLLGTGSLVLFYTSINDRKAAEMMQFDEQGKVAVVRAHYA